MCREALSARSDGEAEPVPAEVTDAHLERIREVDGAVHAFLHVDEDGARETARRVDAQRAAGEPLGPLAGVPLAL
ncbi:MAG TPA: amidase family protein, partial [Umezawaea sp.]|nr:amidase family protein [Umezawaea sp.]